ncbi:FkbM family methyltransferase [Halorubrum yunnanense]|uniref:FkbM family methyltransferase n=1 Tax=Halorubrum yunnanense TaxID=1526162 RepID=A0ABD5YFD6_9EURY|nr:FkbM family methyltransferase [Halorubrum yunnanense]
MLSRFVQTFYNRLLRPHLPRKIASFNGVPVRQPRLLDRTDVRPEYEAPLVSGIEEQVGGSDNVVVVGGGYGVASTYAARRAGPEGNVTVFEGGEEQVSRVRETAVLSRTAETIDVRHAIVGTDKNVYGDSSDASILQPRDLPSCDVLVLDCEGAEIDILEHMSIEPQAIVVETHHVYDAPAEDVRALLHERGYDIVSERIEESPYGDLPVLTAEISDQKE